MKTHPLLYTGLTTTKNPNSLPQPSPLNTTHTILLGTACVADSSKKTQLFYHWQHEEQIHMKRALAYTWVL